MRHGAGLGAHGRRACGSRRGLGRLLGVLAGALLLALALAANALATPSTWTQARSHVRHAFGVVGPAARSPLAAMVAAPGATDRTVLAGASTAGSCLQSLACAPRRASVRPAVTDGAIEGTVTVAGTDAPLPGIAVCAFPADEEEEIYFGERCAQSRAEGEYTITGLAPGNYYVEFSTQVEPEPEPSQKLSYLTQYYDGATSLRTASIVGVSASATTTNIDAAMRPGGSIAGVVTSAAGDTPIKGIEVCAEAEGSVTEAFNCALTNADGEYRITSLRSGEYAVEFLVPYANETLNYVTQYYRESGTYAGRTPVSVTVEQERTGIDASMRAGGRIAGVVTTAATGAPLQGIEVCAFPAAEVELIPRCTTSAADGSYTIASLPTGGYKVSFFVPYAGESGLNYAPRYYDERSEGAQAQTVEVTAGDTTGGIDAAMLAGASISGRVTYAASGAPLEEIEVCAETAGGEGGCTFTAGNGEYAISSLAGGSYYVTFRVSSESPYVGQYYGGVYEKSKAQIVSLASGEARTGVDAALVQAGAPSDYAAPSVSGSPSVGSTLTCAEGGWNGSPSLRFSFQWLRDGAKIEGATGRAYTIQSADQGEALSCQVTATNPKGAAAAVSAAVDVPSPPPPTILPRVLSVVHAPKTTRSDEVQVSLRCTGPLGVCPKATLEIEVVELIRGGRVTGVEARTKRRTVVIGELQATVATGDTHTYTVTLNAAGRRLLAQRHRLQVAVLIDSGSSRLRTVTLALQEPKHRH